MPIDCSHQNANFFAKQETGETKDKMMMALILTIGEVLNLREENGSRARSEPKERAKNESKRSAGR